MSWWSSPSPEPDRDDARQEATVQAGGHAPALNVPGHNDVAIGRYQGTGYRTHQGGRPSSSRRPAQVGPTVRIGSGPALNAGQYHRRRNTHNRQYAHTRPRHAYRF
jgi:hypothetical protein